MTKKFLRRGWFRYSKLGKRRKSKQKWRNPTGRHNKIRDKRRGYPAGVSIGYRTEKKERGLVSGKEPAKIMKISDLERLKKNEAAILGKVGKKKKLEIAKIAEEKHIKILNLNTKKFL